MIHWRTAVNVRYIWHGEWSDPELVFKGHSIDEWSIEDFVCTCMKEEGLDYDDDKLFNEWIADNQELIEATIIEFSNAKEIN